MCSSSTSEPSYTPEGTAGAAAEEELIAVVWNALAQQRRQEGEKARRSGGAGKNGARAVPLRSPPRLLIALWAEKPRGRAWD